METLPLSSGRVAKPPNFTFWPTAKRPMLAEPEAAPGRAEAVEPLGGDEHLLGERSREDLGFRTRAVPGTNTLASADISEGGAAAAAMETPSSAAGACTSMGLADALEFSFCFLLRRRLARAEGAAGKPTELDASAGGGGEVHARAATALRESASAARSRRAAGRRPAAAANPAALCAASAVALAASITFFAASGAMGVK